jgi:hypothetical protein
MSMFLKMRGLVLGASILAMAVLPSPLAAQTTKPAPRRAASASFRIAGIVVNAVTSQPVPHTQVSITNTKDSKDNQSVMTGDDGRFQFQVNAGKFSLQGAKGGFIASAYEQHENFWTGIVTGAGLDTEKLVLRLPPAAAIVGKVLDDAGEPVRETAITVYREDHNAGVSQIQMLTSAVTDDLGTYEVTPLNAGTYFVSVSAQPWYAVHLASAHPAEFGAAVVDRSLDVAFPVSYYKDAIESDDATAIPIRPADRAEVDFHIGAVPALHLTFHSSDPTGRGSGRPILQKPSFDGLSVPQPNQIETVSPGVFEITGVAPGKYKLQTNRADNSMTAPGDVFLNTDGQELDLTSGASAGTVKATVQIRGVTKLPDGLTMALRNAKGRIVAGAQVSDKGEVEFAGLAPDRYEVVAGSAAKIYSVLRITSGGEAKPGHFLNVTSGSSLTVSLDLTGGAVTVEGFARHSGKAAAGVMVVLVPQNPEANLDLFRRDQSDLDGSFALQQIIPGTYTILAIADGWDLDWAKPAVIESYRRHGQKIVVRDEKGSVKLSSPVEVQPKL